MGSVNASMYLERGFYKEKTRTVMQVVTTMKFQTAPGVAPEETAPDDVVPLAPGPPIKFAPV